MKKKTQERIPVKVTRGMSIIGLFCNLSRAYEVAMTGGFSIRVVFDPDYVEAPEDYILIKEFYKDAVFSPAGDIIVDIEKPYNYLYNKQYEALDDIHKRVDAAKPFVSSKEFQSDACTQLLRTASDRLNLSLMDVEKVKEIAHYIAKLSFSPDIRVEHIAEAIHYRAIFENESVTAENDTISFGKRITISRCELDSTDIENAIKYLQSKL